MSESETVCRVQRTSARAGLAVTLCALALLLTIVGCGDPDAGFGGGPGSNRAGFSFECDFSGTPGALELEVEALEASGITWGSGPNPDITGVIGTGQYNYYTKGTLSVPGRTYYIDGSNQFADVWSDVPGDRLVVEWQLWNGGLTIVWDWFGAAQPYPCQMTGSRFL